jgi:tRNA (guanine-N7-)-methyltransferase
MRVRKKKNFDSRMQACKSYLIEHPEQYQGDLTKAFCNLEQPATSQKNTDFASHKKPLHLEIGCGRGKFLAELAQNCQHINFIGLERVSAVLLLAMEKAAAQKLSNLRFINCDARLLTAIFAPGSVDTIYLNFSDPWPKNRHAKNRLTHPNFLALYQSILKKDGHIFLKTDSAELFHFSKQSFLENGFEILRESEDLHNSDIAGNIMTEYETKFHMRGLPIFYLDVVWRGTKHSPEIPDNFSDTASVPPAENPEQTPAQ